MKINRKTIFKHFLQQSNLYTTYLKKKKKKNLKKQVEIEKEKRDLKQNKTCFLLCSLTMNQTRFSISKPSES